MTEEPIIKASFVEKKKLFITVIGQGSPLVLLHGWGFNHQVWHRVQSLLSRQYQLYLVDLPGFGQSPWMEWEIFQTQLLQQLPPKFALLGWSLGGLFAIRLVIEHAQRVSHCISVASSPCFTKQKNWPGIEEKTLKAFDRKLLQSPIKIWKRFVQLQLGAEVHSTDFHQDIMQPVPDVSALRAGLDCLLHWDFRPCMHKLTQPVAYFFGQQDTIVPYHTYEVMSAQYPQFHYVSFPKSGHVPFLTCPETFVQELEIFLS